MILDQLLVVLGNQQNQRILLLKKFENRVEKLWLTMVKSVVDYLLTVYVMQTIVCIVEISKHYNECCRIC